MFGCDGTEKPMAFEFLGNQQSKNTVLWLSFMYFCWGMASSMIYSLLPIYIVENLNGSTKQFGYIEGIAVFFSFLSKLCAGFFIDIFKRKINILYVGTISTMISKILLVLSNSVLFVIIVKSFDRLAKGLRAAPVDAIFAQLTGKKGSAYSLRYTINMSGTLTGSLITSILIEQFNKNFRLIFTLACIPTIVAFYILYKKVKYRDEPYKNIQTRPNWKLSYIKFLPKEYWKFLILVILIMLNRFSEGFITLKARSVLHSDILSSLPRYMALYEFCIITIAFPMGKLSDKINKYTVLLFGMISLAIADIFGILADSRITVIMIYIFSGLHMGITHSLLSSIVARIAPKELIGTAFAIYYGVTGSVLLLTNVFAGMSGILLKKLFGISMASAPFVMGLITTISSIGYILWWQRK